VRRPLRSSVGAIVLLERQGRRRKMSLAFTDFASITNRQD
jgi:hypothetical protein